MGSIPDRFPGPAAAQIEGPVTNIQVVVNHEPTANPTWHMVDQRLRQISVDGNDAVDLICGDDDLPMMVISGHLRSRYRVCVSTDRGSFVLVDARQPEEDVDVTFPYHTDQSCSTRELVGVVMALQAAHCFYDNGTMDATLNWRPA